MSLLEKVYNHAPIWVQNVMCSVKGWTIDRKRYSKDFLNELKRMERREDDPEKLLSDFLELARHVPALLCPTKVIGRREFRA